jgi:hypothetical protein
MNNNNNNNNNNEDITELFVYERQFLWSEYQVIRLSVYPTLLKSRTFDFKILWRHRAEYKKSRLFICTTEVETFPA